VQRLTNVKLTDVADVVRGVSFDKDEVRNAVYDGHLPVLRAGNIEGELLTESDLVWVPESRISRDQRLQVGDIAICMSSGSQSVVGKTALVRREWTGSVGAFCAIIRPKPSRIDPNYLAFFLQSQVFRSWTRQSSGANIKNIRKSELESFSLLVPPFVEQRRIVDILSRAEGIVRLRREAQKKAVELIPALFLDMFGDPVTNPKGWCMASLRNIAQDVRNGFNPTKEQFCPGIRFVTVNALYNGLKIDIEELQTVSIDPKTVEKYRLIRGDICFVRSSVKRAGVGVPSVFDSDAEAVLADS